MIILGKDSVKLKNREFWESGRKNYFQYSNYYKYFTEMALSRFGYENMPDEIDIRFMELILFSEGMCVFFKDEEIDRYLVTRVVPYGHLNEYNIPIKRRAYASNGYQRELTIDNSVIIYNNYLHTGDMYIIDDYARRIWDIDRTIDVNAKAQKTPVLILAEDKERMTLKNMYAQYDGNQPVIYGKKSLDPASITAINTGAPLVAPQLYELRTNLWNEALTHLGIANIQFQKKERLITDEVKRGNGGVIASRNSPLNMREYGFAQINKMFGLNIIPYFKEDTYDSEEDEAQEKEMQNNE